MIVALHAGVTLVFLFCFVLLPLLACSWDVNGAFDAIFIRFYSAVGYMGYWIIYLALT